MSQLLASVIIPYYNRPAALPLTLRALEKQTIEASLFEIIVVDDGSPGDASQWVVRRSSSVPFRLLHQDNRGPGASRNRGAADASSELFLYLDADMIADPDLIQQHVEANLRYPRALIIGRQRPWPEAYPSIFDRVTGYESYRDLGPEPIRASFYHLASGNFSIRRRHFEQLAGFDETLRMTEDTDLGYRAALAGLEIMYWPGAVAFHNHPKTFEQRCRQVYLSALWTASLFQKHPEIRDLLPIYRDVQPIAWGKDSPGLTARKLARRLLSPSPVRSLLTVSVRWTERLWRNPDLLRFLYWKVLGGYRVAGYREGLKRALQTEQ